MSDVFLSYRRSDSSDVVGRIFDHLKTRFGAGVVFKDVESIPLGDDFRTVIADAVGRCKVLLVVIGDGWLAARDGGGNRRLDDPADFVHLEVATALARGIPVIPVLVEHTTMPGEADLPPALKPLAHRNATPVRPDPDFHPDIDRLSSRIATFTGGPKAGLAPPWYRTRVGAVALASAAAVLAVGAFFLVRSGWGTGSASQVVASEEKAPDSEAKQPLDRDVELVGRWKQEQLHIRPEPLLLGMFEVTKTGQAVEIKAIPGARKDTSPQSIRHDAYDGKSWTIIATYLDEVVGAEPEQVTGVFRLDRHDHDGRVFQGSLTTSKAGERETTHRWTKID
ncbi:MAG: toll/interleukin-1 receptor domain-containing protein [Gemmataceae bacterium]